MKTSIIKFIPWLCLLAWFGVMLWWVTGTIRNTPNIKLVLKTNVQQTSKNEYPSEQIVKMMFLGDIMLDRGVEARVKAVGQSNLLFPFLLVKDELLSYDFVMANLEGPVSDIGVLSGSKYSFRFPAKNAEALSQAGIDLVSLANNHIWDYGRLALCDSLLNLLKAGIISVGAGCNEIEANKPAVVDVGSKKVLVFGFTNLYPKTLQAKGDSPGVSSYDLGFLKEQIANFKISNPDGLVVVQAHWGEEYKNRSRNIEQSWAREMIDAGVDLVIGHHPHVTQEMEAYKNRYIVYSLGNFIFDQYFSEPTMQGQAFVLKWNQTTGDLFFKVKDYTINNNYQPVFSDR